MTPPHLACVGHLSEDHRFRVESFPVTPTKTPASDYQCGFGGMAANAAVAAARLGAAVRLYSRVGEDATGATLREALAREGVDVAQVQTVPGTRTSASAVVIDARGERMIFNFRGDALRRAHPLAVDSLAGADAVLVDPRWPAGSLAALQWATRRRLPTMLDGDVSDTDTLRKLARAARWSVFSEPGLKQFAPGAARADALREVIAQGAELAMVTLGERGVEWTDGHALHHAPGFAVRVVDTTAAGDVFHAALLLALVDSTPVAAAVRFASAAAALKCRDGVGIDGAPDRSSVERFLSAQS